MRNKAVLEQAHRMGFFRPKAAIRYCSRPLFL